MRYELDIRHFYQREGKLRLVYSTFVTNGKLELVAGTAEYIGKPETQIEFGYNGEMLYKSREDFPRLLKILKQTLTTLNI